MSSGLMELFSTYNKLDVCQFVNATCCCNRFFHGQRTAGLAKGRADDYRRGRFRSQGKDGQCEQPVDNFSGAKERRTTGVIGVR